MEGFLGLAQLPHEAGHGLHQRFPAPLELGAYRVVQALVFLVAEALALEQGIERQAAALVHVQIEALVRRHAVHLAEQAVARLLELVHELGALPHEGIAFKAPRQLAADGLHGGGQALLELASLSGGQGKQDGAVRVGKIVDVDEVGRQGRLAGLRLKIGKQGIGSPQIAFTRYIDVVTGRLDGQGQIHRLQEPGLKGIAAARPVAWTGDAAAVLPRDAGGVHDGMQTRSGQGRYGRHGVYLLQ